MKKALRICFKLALPGIFIFVSLSCVQKKMVLQTRESVSPEVLKPLKSKNKKESLVYTQAKPVNENKEVKITADRLRYNNKNAETHFTGHVTVQQDSATLYADELLTRNRKESGLAKGHVRLIDERRQVTMRAKQLEYANKLSVAKLKGDVHLVSMDPYGQAVTLTAAAAQVWIDTGKAVLSGGVLARRGAISATAQRAHVDQEKGLVVLKEKVRVGLGDNRFNSKKATLEQEGSRLILEGDVRARFIPSELEDAAGGMEKNE